MVDNTIVQQSNHKFIFFECALLALSLSLSSFPDASAFSAPAAAFCLAYHLYNLPEAPTSCSRNCGRARDK